MRRGATGTREKLTDLARVANSAIRVHNMLQSRPICTIASMAAESKPSVLTVTKALENLERMRIVREATGRQRNRVFVYDRDLAILSRGTEPETAPAAREPLQVEAERRLALTGGP